MQIIHRIISLLYLCAIASAAILLPRKGSSGGGGGHGGGGGGRSSGSSSSGRGSASTGRGGSGDTGHSAISYSSINTGNRNANYFSGGGGRPITLPNSAIFHGRQMGGGVRADVSGTRAFGSGYPYSVREIRTTGVAGQPFPFGFWPIYWGGRGHSGEYGSNSTVADQRPGGDQVIVQLTPNVTTSTWNTTVIGGINETYWMVGDKDSVTTLLSILVDPHASFPNGCGVQNLTVQPFNSSDPLTPVHFENVIQWYRASSFAISFQGYNNSYAQAPLNETAGLGWNDSTPLPVELQYSPFLRCINATILAALPILDGEEPPFSPGQIAGIALGCIAGAVFLCFCVGPCVCALKRNVKDSRERRSRNLKVMAATVQGKTDYTAKTPPSPLQWVKSPSAEPPKPYGTYSPAPSFVTGTTLPEPAFTKANRASFHSSRTLITEPNRPHERDTNEALSYR